jgi:hypothetical protein
VLPLEFETRYEGLLYAIEAPIVTLHRRHPELLDYDVEAALDALIARYAAEQRGRPAEDRPLPGLRQAVLDAVRPGCERWLGRESPSPREPVSLEVVTACLKKVRKSVQRWNREGGRQGYLRFILLHVPVP